MNKKLLFPIVLSGLLFSSLSFKNSFKGASADNVINFDIDKIQALSHCNGVTVNFINDDLVKYWDSDPTDLDNLRALYEMNSEIASFPNNSYDREYTRDLYAKWDDFRPVNNTLTWKSNVKANSFDIAISLNAELTEAVYEAKGLTEPQYTMSNPFANTHYYWQVTAHAKNEDIKSTIFDFYSGDYKRTVDMPTISNTRDVGGFTGKYGTMKQGLIYRSGRIDDVTDACNDALRELDIQTDLDLRKNGEGRTNPAHLNNYYLRTLQSYTVDFREEYRPATIETVRVFTNPDNYPVIFHCAVGRDRTGTLAIILQALAGASREYIIHDYYTSMWSVTGAYQKSLEDLNYTILNDTLNTIESFGDSLSEGAENFLKQREDQNTHQLVGLTEEEINSIRDIWSGKVEVEHGPKTFKAEENYEGKAFVKIKALGHKDLDMMVDKGTKIVAPYELNDGMAWFSNGEEFDFNKEINDTTFIYANYVRTYFVTIHFAGIAKPDEILKLGHGEVLSLDKYNLEGFDVIMLSDEGIRITSLEVTRDIHINIYYMRK